MGALISKMAKGEKLLGVLLSAQRETRLVMTEGIKLMEEFLFGQPFGFAVEKAFARLKRLVGDGVIVGR